MGIGKQLRNADPLVGRTEEMSPQGRATLRSITGVVEQPVMAAPKRRRGLVAGLATGGLAIALGIGLVAWPIAGGGTTLAYADGFDAKVIEADTSPGQWGTTGTLQLPLPVVDGKQGYRVLRFWLKDGATPITADKVTFKKQASDGDSAVYKSVDFPFGDFELAFYGPNSEECKSPEGGNGIAVASSSDEGVKSSVLLCDGTFAEDITDSTSSSGPEGELFTIEGTGTDPQALADKIGQFQLGSDGKWASAPAGNDILAPADLPGPDAPGDGGTVSISSGDGSAVDQAGEVGGSAPIGQTVGGDQTEVTESDVQEANR
ncbi:MAG: hypothetical protein LBR32_08205 [Propionibacteriaceae bacterium]|jgi:hypothetical protein|nr:hypothetical protein [Propionibacteriaceae bacterium]